MGEEEGIWGVGVIVWEYKLRGGRWGDGAQWMDGGN